MPILVPSVPADFTQQATVVLLQFVPSHCFPPFPTPPLTRQAMQALAEAQRASKDAERQR